MRRLAEVLVVTQILAGQQLRYENYLAGVLSEMFHHVQDRFHLRYIVLLNGAHLCQPLWREISNDVSRVRNGRLQTLQEFHRLQPSTSGELTVTVPEVGLPANSIANPLSDIPA